MQREWHAAYLIAYWSATSEDERRAVANKLVSEALRRNGRKLLHVAYSVLENTDDAEDVVQETMIKLYENIATLQPHGNVELWLHKVARRKAVDLYRMQRVRTPPRATVAAEPSTTPAIELELTIKALLDESSPLTKDVASAFFAGYTYREISDLLDLTASAPKNHVHRLYERLRRSAKEAA